MNYIYDIVLNFNKKNIYKFFEWREEDEPEFILKIPVFKISIEDMNKLKNNNFCVNKSFLNSLFDKTEVYAPNAVKKIKYSCVFANEECAFAVEFDNDGNSYMKSNISIDEENEIIEFILQMKYTIIDYKITSYNKSKNEFSTRREKEASNHICKSLEKMFKNRESSKLKYIFYEIYSEKMDDYNRAYVKLLNIANNKDSKFYELEKLINLIENKKILNNYS